ncbi:MAG: prepilin-type N-terminal cleavage/methylation domain-containing protein [candidate division Zixibacteria bacterium]
MKKGFTLIELLIVIAVISILVSIALPRFRGMQDEGNIAKAKGELRTLQTAVESYYIHNNNVYPANLGTLDDQIPRIVGNVPTDPFTSGADYGYARSGSGVYYVLYSIGPALNGSAGVDGNGDVTESNGNSCIFATNGNDIDTRP